MSEPTRAKHIFTYEEALATFPRVQELTLTAVRQIEAMSARLQSREEREARAEELEAAYDEIVRRWSRRVIDLGCEVKGLWTVDWDSGHGYFCWTYPEESLSHFHDYDDGFEGRVPIQ